LFGVVAAADYSFFLQLSDTQQALLLPSHFHCFPFGSTTHRSIMGQPLSAPRTNAAVATPQQHSARHQETLREEQQSHLRAQLARLADALAVAEGSATAKRQGALAGDSGKLALSHDVGSPSCSASAVSASAFLLQPFAEVHLAGYQLGNDPLTTPTTLFPKQPPVSPLCLLGRNTALSVLDLSYNGLSVAIMKPLLDAVGTLPALMVLRLSGNAIGSDATTGHGDTRDNTPTRKAVESGKEGSGALLDEDDNAQTAAAQLGRWLATNPPLKELCLYQCALTDGDVQAVVRGLIPSKDTATPTSSSLTSLQLAGNPACTWRTAQMVLQLLTELGNESLLAVEMEGAPPATEVRLEYACTPDGYFRSGTTLVAAMDAVDANPHAEAATLSEAEWMALTPAQSTRFRSRCRYLREDLDGTHVMKPALMKRVHAVLAERRATAAATINTTASTDANAGCTTATLQSNHAGGGSEEGEGGVDRSEQQRVLNNAGEAAVEEPNTCGEASSATAEGEEEVCSASSDTPRPHSRVSSAASAKVTAPPSTPPLFLTGRSSRQSPQERRAARFETPERISRVMADAHAFRRHVHPMQVDTHAPACAEVHTPSTSSQYGSEAAAATWYARAGFVLRPNGMSKVLVAPVLSGAASARRNVLLTELEDRPLRACWCTPRKTTNATSYAGVLHYHCVREGDPVHHKGGLAATAVAYARRAQHEKKNKMAASTGAAGEKGSAQLLPPLTATATPAFAVSEYHPRSNDNGGRTYSACCGTGHACLSSAVAANGPLRSHRMRTALLAQSIRRSPSSASRFDRGGHDTRFPTSRGSEGRQLNGLLLRSPHPRSSSAPAMPPKTGGGVEGSTTTTAPATMFGGATKLLTTSGGFSVAVNYSPVAFFSSPHVPCAAGIQVEECT
jgi:hypothetical protein